MVGYIMDSNFVKWQVWISGGNQLLLMSEELKQVNPLIFPIIIPFGIFTIA